MDNSFENIVKSYYKFTPVLPEKYIRLILETFEISANDKIIDLGCGSGDLTLALNKHASSVEGIDISKTMITKAREKDKNKQVTWIQDSVENFDLGEEKYNLIISFESFHLFPRQKELIQRCAKALKPGGFLSIGWRMYEWDIPLKKAIKETFDAYGIDRGEWGLWTCPTFFHDIEMSKTDLKAPQQRKIAIKTKTSIDVIANNVLNNSRSAHIHNDRKKELQKALRKSFLEIYPSGQSDGYTEFVLMYAQK